MPGAEGRARANIDGMIAGEATRREGPVTKSKEKGENEITAEARRRAKETGRTVCEILAEMLSEAKKARDNARAQKIKKAQKFLKCRNVRKREDNR
jgi:hypothetical protein